MTVTNRDGQRGGAQFLTIIPERDVYRLIMRSHLPQAKDVCDVLNLELRGLSKTILDDDEKGRRNMPTPGGNQQMTDTNKALLVLDDDEKCKHEQYSGSGRKPMLVNESDLLKIEEVESCQ